MINHISWIDLFKKYKPSAYYVPGTFQMISILVKKNPRWWFLPTRNWETQTKWIDSEVYRVREMMTFWARISFSQFPLFSTLLLPHRTPPESKCFRTCTQFSHLFTYMFTAHTCTPGSRDNFQLWFKSSDLLHNGMFKSSQNREEFVKK